MNKALRTTVYNTCGKDNPPALTVKPGERFLVETQLNGGDWLQSKTDLWAPGKSCGPNLCTVVAVAGAQPGDTLAVTIHNIDLAEIGYTGFAGWRLPFCQEVWPNDWDVVTRTVSIADGFVHWSDNLKLPIQPMIGTIGTAPAGQAISNALAQRHGGNMDVQEVRPGTTIYLPIAVTDALLHVGDVHALMGDGEICHGGGIECRSTVELSVKIIPGQHGKGWLRLEDEDYIMTIACEEDMKTSMAASIRELIAWLTQDYGFKPEHAYALLGQVLEARCTVVVSPMYCYICKISKRFLKHD